MTAAAAAAAAPCSPLIDLRGKVEIAPLVVPPAMPLPFLYSIMQEQGLNYVPVIQHHGPLVGMVTRLAHMQRGVGGLVCARTLVRAFTCTRTFLHNMS